MLAADYIYQKTYRLNSDSDRITIKLISNQNIGVAENIAETFDNSYIIQFEYIYISYILSDLYYNISNINKRIL